MAAAHTDEAAAQVVAAAKAVDAADVAEKAKKLASPNLTVDGNWGAPTTAALQAAWINNSDATVLQENLGVTADGVFGLDSVKALQERLNAGTF